MSQGETEELLKELIEVTRQNQRWLRILARSNVQEAVSSALSEPWEYELFDSLDGATSANDLAEDLPKSSSTVGRRLNTWQQIGIVEQAANSQYDKIAPLSMLGVEIPETDSNENE